MNVYTWRFNSRGVICGVRPRQRVLPMFHKPAPTIRAGFEDPDGKGTEAFYQTLELNRERTLACHTTQTISKCLIVTFCIFIVKSYKM